MKKLYKKLFSTAIVISMVISQNAIVFAKEKDENNNIKKISFTFERKEFKNYLDILANGKETKKEVTNDKVYEIINGIDLAVIESNKKDINLEVDKLIKDGAEMFIYIDNNKINALSSTEITRELKKNSIPKKEENNKSIETKREIKKEEIKSDKELKKIKVEVAYKEKDSSKEIISLKNIDIKDNSNLENTKKEEVNKKDNIENKKEENNSLKKEEVNKSESNKENKLENNFNSEDVIGKTSTELIGDYYIAGKEESNLANLINDALLKKTNAEISMTSAGSMLRNIAKGEIKYSDVVESVIFGNTVITKKLTGKQIKDAIELGVSIYPESSSTFLHFGNVTYTIDANKVSGNRVTNVKVKGKNLEDSKQYLVAMNDYMSTDYNSISGVSTEKNYGELDKIIAEYIKSKENLNYKNDGRIKIISKVNINREKVKKVVKAIDNLTFDKNKANIKAVNDTIKLFNELNQDERKQVTNYKRLIKIADYLRKDGVGINKPGNQSSSNNNQSSSNRPGSNKTEKQKSPKTADTSSLMTSVSTLLVAAGGLGILRKKKNK
ncbi:5'-nucleotidase C-terminal domain-containing protein [Peptacetobacter sp.]|uniref:5'-nucleotidase C-terminal domain-containing protein n=1 Tax=Peptacetobacter sp. TaxID=2991975 RepID=UPI00260C6707|nr:5'-nucleotidase C-terminal domain-containing protein [Peptacetobacter sp.]